MAQARTPVRRLEHVTRDRGYRFVDRDPAMVELCNLITDSGMSIPDIVEAVAKATSGTYKVSATTIANWQNGTTRRPQNYTLNWVAHALGYERKWTKRGE